VQYVIQAEIIIMKIGTRARAAENPRARAARTILIYFAGTKVQYSTKFGA
jgi:hypothetical protein